jgi:hypothetical protein
MADEAPQSVDFWSELEEAHQTVEQWPEWQQRYEADVNGEGSEPRESAPVRPSPAAAATPPA